MNTNRIVALVSLSVAIASLVPLVGCSHSNSEPTLAAPGSKNDPIANNPPAGQPNHLSPDMQAQIEHYRAMGTTR